MEIRITRTPNPDAMRFLPGRAIAKESLQVTRDEAATLSPLAKTLFEVPGVALVYLGSDFITVTREPNKDWGGLAPAVRQKLSDYLTSGRPILNPSAEFKGASAAMSPVVAMIKDCLKEIIQPQIAKDGGEAKFESFDPKTGIVLLEMRGACAGCPSSAKTLRDAIEKTLTTYVGEVRGVRATAGPALTEAQRKQGFLKRFGLA